MRRKIIVSLQTVFLFLVYLSLFTDLGRILYISGNGENPIDRLKYAVLPIAKQVGLKDNTNSESNENDSVNSPSTPPKQGNATLFQIAPLYIKAITTPEDNFFPRLACPAPSHGRYDYFRDHATTIPDPSVRPKYFFALDLHQCAKLLPRLLGSVVESMRFLGPHNCALSVVEGRSDDGTFEILRLLRDRMEPIGVKYFFVTNEIDPLSHDIGNRVEALAELRNQALRPLVDHPDQYSTNTTVLFLNDVSLCMEDILELIHQRLYQNADMTCAMDWTYVGRDPTFYDVWIARGMNGDTFFNIPEDSNWNSAWDLFWNNPKTYKRFTARMPFQVFSCWNGATAFTAKPLIDKKVRFRGPYDEECYQGEPRLFCKDIWYHGYRKIAVVPSINLEYSDEAAGKIKSAKGYVSNWVESEGRDGMMPLIEWEMTPPPLVKCMANYANQTWVPWDEQLAEHDAVS